MTSLSADRSRRNFLQLAAAGVFAPSLSGWLPVLARAAEAAPRKPVKSVILLWMDGGPSHHDTFDPKPDAPADVRGPFAPIATSVPSIQVTDRLPQVARHMHHAAVLRGTDVDQPRNLAKSVTVE